MSAKGTAEEILALVKPQIDAMFAARDASLLSQSAQMVSAGSVTQSVLVGGETPANVRDTGDEGSHSPAARADHVHALDLTGTGGLVASYDSGSQQFSIYWPGLDVLDSGTDYGYVRSLNFVGATVTTGTDVANIDIAAASLPQPLDVTDGPTFASITIAPTGSAQPYKFWGEPSGTEFYLQGQTAGDVSRLDIFSHDGDSTDRVGWQVFGKGTPATLATGNEAMRGEWDAVENVFRIVTTSAGTGVKRRLIIDTDLEDGTQLVFNTGSENVGFGVPYPQSRIHIASDGNLNWDNGSGTGDTGFYRSAAATVKSTGMLDAANGLRTPITGSTPTGGASGDLYVYSGTTPRMWSNVAGSWQRVDFGRTVILKVVPDGTSVASGTNQMNFTVPEVLAGMNLVSANAHVYTVSSSGLPTVQLYNVTKAHNMLSTAITIDASETDSTTAATPPVIDTSYDDVAAVDDIRVDVSVAGTGTKGLEVRMVYRMP